MDAPSASSKSKVTGFEGDNVKQLKNGRSGLFDMFFPIFDAMHKNTTLPFIVIFAFVGWTDLQLIFTSLWPMDSFYEVNADKIKGFMYYAHYAMYFFPPNPSQNEFVLTSVVLLAIVTATIVYYLSIFFYFKRTYRINTWSLYPANFIAICVDLVIVHPIATMVGISIVRVNDGESIYIVALILGVIFYIVVMIWFMFANSLKSRSIYLHIDSNSMFEPTLYPTFIMISSVLVALQYLMTLMQDWTIVLLQILHFAFSFYVGARCVYYTYHLPENNALASALFTVCPLMDLVMIIIRFVPNTSEFVPIALMTGFFVLLCAVSMAFDTMLVKKVTSVLNDETIEGDFDFGRYIRHKRWAEVYLRVGFTQHCNRFLDWSLINYVLEKYPDMIFQVMQIIAYFPSEIRKLNVLFNEVVKKERIAIYDRFLIYEVQNLRILRQYSASSEATETLTQMREMSEQVEKDVQNLIFDKEPSIKRLEGIGMSTKNLIALWEKVLEIYPNNAKFYEVYSKFLIEACTDFHAGIRMKHKAEKVEAGHSYAVDRSFNYMVKALPQYLKKKIVNHRGNFIVKKNLNGSQSSNSIHSDKGTSDITENEESIGKQIITYSKLRIGLQNAVDGAPMWQTSTFPFIITLMIIATVLIFVFVNLHLQSIFQNRKNSMNGQILTSQMRFFTSIAIIAGQLKFANDTGRGDTIPQFLGEKMGLDYSDGLFSYLFESDPYSQTIVQWVSAAEGVFTGTMIEFGIMAGVGFHMYEFAESFLTNRVDSEVCLNGELTTKYKRGLNTIIQIAFYQLLDFSSYTGTDEWFEGDPYCLLEMNYRNYRNEFEYLFSTIHADQHAKTDALTHELLVMIIVVPIVVFLIISGPFMFYIITFMLQVKGYLGMFLIMETNMKKEMSKYIVRTADQSEDIDEIVSESKVKTAVISYLLILSIAIGLLEWGIMFAMIWNARVIHFNIKDVNFWQDYATIRLFDSVDSLHIILDSILLSGNLSQKHTQLNERIRKAVEFSTTALVQDQNILAGTSDVGSCANFDDELDNLNFVERCNPDIESSGDHDIYRCASTTNAMKIYDNYIVNIANNLNRTKGRFDSDEVMNLIHLGATHLWDRLLGTVTRLADLATVGYTLLVNQSNMFTAIGCVILILVIMLEMFIQGRMKLLTRSCLTLVKRISPFDVVNHKEIMKYLLHHVEAKKDTAMSVSRAAIHNSFDGISLLSLTGIIEIANPAMITTLGYKLDQLLGQNVSAFFKESDGQKIETQLNLMIKKETAPVYEDHLTCIDDSNSDVPVNLTIMLMKKPNIDEPHSFVMILRDERELVLKQREAEQSKLKSEQLLYQILPRDIVIKLNSGEKDISFSVASASIMFVDIQKFSEYAAGLTPSGIMEHLSTVFASFDQCAKKYHSLTKIKLIGDTYMAAGGLFAHEGELPKTHAEQILHFGLDCLTALEDINANLNSNLAVRIGVNSGGPLIAGVLGSEKPVFDIIGDPINVAARLQSTDEAGKIQISQNTLDLIQGLDFAIEERGEVFLKGKGKTKTYFVLQPSNFFINSITAKRRASISFSKPLLLPRAESPIEE